MRLLNLKYSFLICPKCTDITKGQILYTLSSDLGLYTVGMELIKPCLNCVRLNQGLSIYTSTDPGETMTHMYN